MNNIVLKYVHGETLSSSWSERDERNTAIIFHLIEPFALTICNCNSALPIFADGVDERNVLLEVGAEEHFEI